MVRRISPPGVTEFKWVIQPTRSFSWRQAKILIFVVAAVSLTIGGIYWARGLPLVLPFSGIEVIALAAAFYHVLRRGEQREVVSITRDLVVVEKGRHRPESRHELQRYWTRVRLDRSPLRWHPSRLYLTSYGDAVELGGFLSEGERRALADALINAMRKNQ